MATLEKIRSRSVLLVSVIFVALFLFIITIVDNPMGLVQDHTTVAKVKGDKIDYEKYQNRANQLREQNPNAEGADAQALEGLIMESLMNREFDNLGITVTDAEITEAMVGEKAAMMTAYRFQQTHNGVTPEEFYSYMTDPDSYGIPAEQVQAMEADWMNFENEVEQMLKSQKLYSLLVGTIKANKVDAKAMFDEGNTTYTIVSVGKSLYSQPDTLTDEDIKAYYANHRADYAIKEPHRYVRYVNLDIKPSQADRNAALDAAAMAVADLSEKLAMEGLAGNSTFVVDYITADADELTAKRQPTLSEFLKGAAIDSVYVINNAVYSPANPSIVIAKLLDRQTKVNGAKITQFQIDPSYNADSVVAQLNSGADHASIKGLLGEAQTYPVKYSQLPDEIADTLNAAGVNVYLPLSGPNGSVAVAVTAYDEPSEIYEYATATYSVEPSKTTIDELKGRMRSFLEKVSSVNDFNAENAMMDGLMVNDEIVNASSNSLANLTDSRGIVAWAMEADKGDVSHVFTDSRNSRMTAVAVADIYDGKYIPVSFPQIRNSLEVLALNEKRTDILVKELSGKGTTLADYAKIMGATPDTVRNVNFANNSARFAPLAGIRGHKPGDVVGPLRWNSSVVVYEVIDATEGTMPYDEKSNLININNRMQGIVINDLKNLLLGDDVVENRILKFTRQ